VSREEREKSENSPAKPMQSVREMAINTEIYTHTYMYSERRSAIPRGRSEASECNSPTQHI